MSDTIIANFAPSVFLLAASSELLLLYISTVKHSLIVAVNGLFNRDRARGGEGGRGATGPRRAPPLQREETLQIDINVIQPTPNISPTCSIRLGKPQKKSSFLNGSLKSFFSASGGLTPFSLSASGGLNYLSMRLDTRETTLTFICLIFGQLGVFL